MYSFDTASFTVGFKLCFINVLADISVKYSQILIDTTQTVTPLLQKRKFNRVICLPVMYHVFSFIIL